MSLSPVVYDHLQESLDRQVVYTHDCLAELLEQDSLMKRLRVVGVELPESVVEYGQTDLASHRGFVSEHRDKVSALRRKCLREYKWFLLGAVVILGSCLLLFSAVNLMEVTWAFYNVIVSAVLVLQGIFVAGYSFMDLREDIDEMNGTWLNFRMALRAGTADLARILVETHGQSQTAKTATPAVPVT